MANTSLPVDWNAIRDAAIAGVPYRAIAIQWGIIGKDGKPNTGAIRVRALREKWPVITRIVHHAKKRAKEASQALEVARKLENERTLKHSYHKPNSPNVTKDTIREGTEMGDMEPGLEEPDYMAGIRNQGSKEAGIGGNSASIPAPGGTREHESGEGTKNLLSIGKVGNASQSLQTSESLAATLIQSHMAQLAQESIIQALQRAHASIHAAPAQLPIATIADLRSAMKLAMEATGLDKQQNNTQLNILVSPTPKQGTWNFHDSPELPVIDT
jgi:hypothetical protein